MPCRPSSFMKRAPYKIKVVVGERIKIRDESRVLLVMLARFVAAAHDRALSIASSFWLFTQTKDPMLSYAANEIPLLTDLFTPHHRFKLV